MKRWLKWGILLAAGGVFILGGWTIQAWAGPMKMRIVVVNPSDSKPQTKTIKSYLPKEVTKEDVISDAGLSVEYDPDQGLFYVYKETVELAPLETKTFEVVVNDVWVIPDDKLEQIRIRTQTVMEHLKGTAFAEQSQIIADTVLGRLEKIVQTQSDPNVSRQQHIAFFRDNQTALQALKEDLQKLEKLAVATGGPASLEMMEEGEAAPKAPTIRATWVVIFAILVFIGVLGGAFYFTWHSQVRITENIFTKEKNQQFPEFKSDPPPPEKNKGSGE